MDVCCLLGGDDVTPAWKAHLGQRGLMAFEISSEENIARSSAVLTLLGAIHASVAA